ncbi:hypothetical protein DOT37_17330 [Pantoea agglomerans]|nr:hypothetical protein DOT37_17330 [Pantoea agglomerans]
MAVRSRLLQEHGQIGKALKPSMDARPTPSMAWDAFLLCPCSLRLEFMRCGQMYPGLDLSAV